jgi:hypothetical protein
MPKNSNLLPKGYEQKLALIDIGHPKHVKAIEDKCRKDINTSYSGTSIYYATRLLNRISHLRNEE